MTEETDLRSLVELVVFSCKFVYGVQSRHFELDHFLSKQHVLGRIGAARSRRVNGQVQMFEGKILDPSQVSESKTYLRGSWRVKRFGASLVVTLLQMISAKRCLGPCSRRAWGSSRKKEEGSRRAVLLPIFVYHAKRMPLIIQCPR